MRRRWLIWWLADYFPRILEMRDLRRLALFFLMTLVLAALSNA